MYLAYIVMDQNLNQVQLSGSSGLGWTCSCIWNQQQGGLQAGWSRVALAGVICLCSIRSLILIYMMLCRVPREQVEKCEVSWRLGLKVEHIISIVQTKLQEYPKLKVTSYGYKEENNHG